MGDLGVLFELRYPPSLSPTSQWRRRTLVGSQRQWASDRDPNQVPVASDWVARPSTEPTARGRGRELAFRDSVQTLRAALCMAAPAWGARTIASGRIIASLFIRCF